jgi:spore maturation protein SpmA
VNAIFLALIVGAVLMAAFSGTMPAVKDAGIDAAKDAVTLAIGLIGQMAMWLGFMRVLRDAGVMRSIGRGLAPVMRRLFPEIPVDHPAMSAMIMNLAANMLGLGNAATPFGLKAMAELSRLNTRPGVASNSMVLFLAINTSGVAVLPLGVIALRSTLGAADAGGIIVPSLLATACSTLVGVTVAIALSRRRSFAAERYTADEAPAAGSSIADGVPGLEEAQEIAETETHASGWRVGILLLFLAGLAVALILHAGGAPPETTPMDLFRDISSNWLLPLLMATIVMFGFSHRVKVYESFVNGAREGFRIGVMIIPFLVAILVAVGMFRHSGMMELLFSVLRPLTDLIGFPVEALPMALVRPLSGSGALGVMTETMTSYGPDSFVGFLVSVMNGSTETTFYVLAVYYGSVQIRAVRHTIAACLAADVTGVLAAYFFSVLFF